MKPIILDRSRLEQYAECPRQAYLSMIFDAVKAKAEGLEVFPWEAERIKDADPILIKRMEKVALESVDGGFATCGTEIHSLIEKAFVACEGDTSKTPEWLVDHLATVRPDIQPMAVRHARHAADMISEYHINLIAVEAQVSIIIKKETATSPAIVVSMRYDMIGSGKNNLHIMDWKTGFKRRTNSEARDSFQANFGSWLLWQQPKYAEIETIHFWYYETLHGSKAYAYFERNHEDARLPGLTTEAAIKGRVMSAVEAFEKNLKEPWPLPQKCAWCDFIRFCPYASMEAREIAADPKAFVDNLVVLKELTKRRNGILAEWVKAKGPVAGTKVIAGKKVPTERFTLDFSDKAKPKGSVITGDDDLDSHFT